MGDILAYIELMLSMPNSLIFPQWDMVTVILCVFLLSYVYGEGKVSSRDFTYAWLILMFV